MLEDFCGFATLFVLSVAVALLVYALLRKSLGELLDETIAIPSGRVFYSRLLLIGLIFVALSSALGTEFSFSADTAFMEYVWRIAGGLSMTFGLSCLFLTAYLVLITIVVAAFRRRHEQ